MSGYDPFLPERLFVRLSDRISGTSVSWRAKLRRPQEDKRGQARTTYEKLGWARNETHDFYSLSVTDVE